MIYPSGRAVWLAAAGVVPAFLVAVFLPALWYLGLAWPCAVIGFTLVDAVAGPGRASVGASIASTPRVPVGGIANVTVTVEQRGTGIRRIEVRPGIDERLAPVDGGHGTIVAPDQQLTLRFHAKRRGIARIDRLWLRWRGPFGLAWKQAVVPVNHGVVILPDLDRVREDAITLLQKDLSFGEQSQQRGGQGREFEALKEYQPGMGRRFIDWKRSARHTQLLAKEFRTEQNNNIVLAVDSGRLMCEPLDGIPKVDRAVTAALLTSFVALKAGDLVSLFSFDARPVVNTGASRGASSFPMIQALAAQIDYSAEETNFTLALSTLMGKLTRRSLVVVFTDFVDAIGAELMLRAVGRLTDRHMVLFVLMRDGELEGLADAEPQTMDDVARAVTAGTLLRERELVIGRLKLLGAQVIEADHRSIGPALVERYLAIKQRDAL